MPASLALALWIMVGTDGLDTDSAGRFPADVALEECMEADWSTHGMIACQTTALESWDRDLNTAYKALRAQLNPQQQELLKQAQRQWISQRDADFALIENLYGSLDGSLYRSTMVAAKVDVVRQRALSLRGLLEVLLSSQQ